MKRRSFLGTLLTAATPLPQIAAAAAIPVISFTIESKAIKAHPRKLKKTHRFVQSPHCIVLTPEGELDLSGHLHRDYPL